jgi:hypothetical protein
MSNLIQQVAPLELLGSMDNISYKPEAPNGASGLLKESMAMELYEW